MKTKEKKQCSVGVYDSISWHSYPCSKNANIERNGKLYCTIHDPEYIKEKLKKREEMWEKEKCNKCSFSLREVWYKYCPVCGTKK